MNYGQLSDCLKTFCGENHLDFEYLGGNVVRVVKLVDKQRKVLMENATIVFNQPNGTWVIQD